MKNLFVKGALLCAFLISGVNANAQFNLGNVLKGIVSGSKSDSTENTDSSSSGTSGILSTLTNIFSDKLVATKDKIIGTWVYEEPAVVLSSDNMLQNLGGKLASSAVESKLKSKMEGFGFKKGSVTMTFDKDGNFTQTFKGKTMKGTYTLEDKNVVLKYAGKVSQIIGTTQLDGNNLLIVMDASKLLKYVNVLGTVSNNSTLKTATSLISGMDGLECGLKLKKQ